MVRIISICLVGSLRPRLFVSFCHGFAQCISIRLFVSLFSAQVFFFAVSIHLDCSASSF